MKAGVLIEVIRFCQALYAESYDDSSRVLKSYNNAKNQTVMASLAENKIFLCV